METKTVIRALFILISVWSGHNSSAQQTDTFYRISSEKLTERFIRYVKYNTQSDPNATTRPSTTNQKIFAEVLAEELKQMGMSDVSIDENCYLTATLPPNSAREVPTIGFIAHMDTHPELSGKDVNPRIISDYDGGDIILHEKQKIILSPKNYPELKKYKHQDLIVTDGNTLLGADDKAGIAEIMTAMEYLIHHPEIKHGQIRIAFTPDEEIGTGIQLFDTKKFGAKWAYTIDGGEVGGFQYESFNAAKAIINIKGQNTHAGSAKNKMINAIYIAQKLTSLLPENERPEQTEEYEGFFHLNGFHASVSKATLSYLIRDHDMECFEKRKKLLTNIVQEINHEYGDIAEIQLQDQYYNMKEKIEQHPFIIDVVTTSMNDLGIDRVIVPIRGGTDGSQLSYRGLPCPNIFTGGANFHENLEYIPIPSMEKACMLIIRIIENVTKTAPIDLSMPTQ